MPIQQSLLSYISSIGSELKNSKDRIRSLIGRSHWLTDGEHKETILRNVLKNHIPEIFNIGSGFVCYPGAESYASNQLDILVTHKYNPTLYKLENMYVVTPDCVEAIVEVKTKVTSKAKLDEIIYKLTKNVKDIRASQHTHKKCWAGLFIYENSNLTDREVLLSLQESTSDLDSTLNCVAVGNNMFIRFWEDGYQNESSNHIWHSYNLEDLAQSYFLSNLVHHLSYTFDENAERAWFPIIEEGENRSKENYRMHYAELNNTTIGSFN